MVEDHLPHCQEGLHLFTCFFSGFPGKRDWRLEGWICLTDCRSTGTQGAVPTPQNAPLRWIVTNVNPAALIDPSWLRLLGGIIPGLVSG